jgi:hypothetical protein
MYWPKANFKGQVDDLVRTLFHSQCRKSEHLKWAFTVL